MQRADRRSRNFPTCDSSPSLSHRTTMADSLSSLFRRGLSSLSKASNLPSIQDETQVARLLPRRRPHLTRPPRISSNPRSPTFVPHARASRAWLSSARMKRSMTSRIATLPIYLCHSRSQRPKTARARRTVTRGSHDWARQRCVVPYSTLFVSVDLCV
jgi:hypothetical protein